MIEQAIQDGVPLEVVLATLNEALGATGSMSAFKSALCRLATLHRRRKRGPTLARIYASYRQIELAEPSFDWSATAQSSIAPKCAMASMIG